MAGEPTREEQERAGGRVAVWLDPGDADWLSKLCVCADDATPEERERCARVRIRMGAALHKAGRR